MISHAGRLRPFLRLVPAWMAVVGVGGAGFVLVGWNLLREVDRFGVGAPPLSAALLGAVLAGGAIVAGLWLRERDLGPVEAWLVTAFSLAGGLLLATAQALTIVIRAAEGRPIGEPLFPVLVVTLVGFLGGFATGYLYVRARGVAAKAERTRDAIAFANGLLRHDVRNSLQVIDGRVELLKDIDDDTAQEHVTAIRGQTESLEALITEAQAVVEAVTGEQSSATVDLGSLLAETVEATQQSHPDASIETDVREDLTVRGSEALRSVFDNLLSNAVEHAGGDVTVRVTATESDGRVSVRVADDGPGVPEADRERIFEAGVSEDDGGHGLYVARTIVEQFDGTITVEDSDLGGAVFIVTLPAETE